MSVCSAGIPAFSFRTENRHGFGKTRPCCQHGFGRQGIKHSNAYLMIAVSFVKQCDQRSGVSQSHSFPLCRFSERIPPNLFPVFSDIRAPPSGRLGINLTSNIKSEWTRAFLRFPYVVQELIETQIGQMRPPLPYRPMCAAKNGPPCPPAAGKGCQMNR